MEQFHSYYRKPTSDKVPKQFPCNYCDKVFARSRSRNMHMRKIHKFQLPRKPGKLKCPGKNCNFITVLYHDLRKHISECHVQLEECIELNFQNMTDFEEWKEKEEKETRSFFTKTSGDKLSKSLVKTKYFTCHRSGFFKPGGQGKRHARYRGSVKIGATCPARISAEVSANGRVSVLYYRNHYGHDLDLGTLTLTPKERNAIADKIREGIPFRRILDDIRNSVQSVESINRLHLLTRKDLINISKSLNFSSSNCDSNNAINHEKVVASNSVHLDSNDATSVDDWVASVKNSANNPVIFYKAQKEDSAVLGKDDFVLVLMDQLQINMLLTFEQPAKFGIDFTHGTNGGNFYLITIFVIDELGFGFPIAFCLSNRIDADSLAVVFTAIKDKVGCLDASLFMSNDNQACYDAWKFVMGDVSYRLLCPWYVDRDWRRNLARTKIAEKAPARKVQIYRALRALMEESDELSFLQNQTRFVDDLINNDETKDFAVFFSNAYASRAEKWAYCYAKLSGLSANMYQTPKQPVYFKCKKTKRMDECIFSFLSFMKDKEFDWLNKIAKRTPTYVFKRVRRTHNEGLSIPESDVTEIECGRKWQVKSSTDSNRVYEVERKLEMCGIKNCSLICEICQICMHCFTCTCVTHSHQSNVCKHVHRILSLPGQFFVMNVLDDTSVYEEYCDMSSSPLTISAECEVVETNNRNKEATKNLVTSLESALLQAKRVSLPSTVAIKLTKDVEKIVHELNQAKTTDFHMLEINKEPTKNVHLIIGTNIIAFNNNYQLAIFNSGNVAPL